MNPKHVVRVVGHGIAVTGVVNGIRRARNNGDKLRLVEAVVQAIAVVVGVLILVRTLREERNESMQEFTA